MRSTYRACGIYFIAWGLLAACSSGSGSVKDGAIASTGGWVEPGSGGVVSRAGGEIPTGGLPEGGVVAAAGGEVASGGNGPDASSSQGGSEAADGGSASGGVMWTGGVLGPGGAVVTGGVLVSGGSAVDAPVATGGLPGTGGIAGAGGIASTGGAGGGVVCGGPGYPCCAGNTCAGGGCCVSGLCMAPGASCIGYGGGICTDGACGSCGAPGQPCCGTSKCTAPGTVCSGTLCARCGGVAGTPCCQLPAGSTENACLVSGLQCNGTLCAACGKPGTPCCPGSVCDGQGCCYNGACVADGQACGAAAGQCATGRCSGCGALSQPCCGTQCYDGFLCRTSTCSSCGGLGEPCCATGAPGGRCKAGGACNSATADGICAKCGGLGEACCEGNACASGCCSAGRCIAGSLTPGGSCVAGSLDGGADGCATGGSPCVSLPAFSGTQVLDGSDSEFCQVPSFEFSFANAALVTKYNTGTMAMNERVVARVAWDATGIHAFIRVYDPVFVPARNIDTIWDGDGVELMFSNGGALTGSTYSDTNTMHVIFSPPLAVRSKASGTTGYQSTLSTTVYVASVTADGYVVELNVPWPGTPPLAGSTIRMDMQLNSADGPMSAYDSYTRDAQAVLSMGTIPSSPSCSPVYPYCDDRVWCATTLQ